MDYRIIPIPNDICDEVRRTLVSPQYKSLKAFASLATGYGPCRSCLRVFDEGKDERIYLTYNSFEGLSDLPDPGPIFIHRNACKPFDGNGFPPDLARLPLVFEGFADRGTLICRHHIERKNISKQISGIFEADNVRFINIRNAEAGCFVARIERHE